MTMENQNQLDFKRFKEGKQKRKRKQQKQPNKNSKWNDSRNYSQVVEEYKKFEPTPDCSYDDYPLTLQLKEALKIAEYPTPTPIQRATVHYAMRGHDILAKAKTGSGKTLAFLIPVMERLTFERFGPEDGCGALILSPTKEIANQTYNEIRKLSHKCVISGARVVGGGVEFKKEQKTIGRINIVIGTPGRIIHHLRNPDKNFPFNLDNLRMLVLDETDELVKNGGGSFEKQINFILDSSPSDRQTLLFSATQTKKVNELKKVSLKNPKHIDLAEDAVSSLPDSLSTTYMVCELDQKINILYSMIKLKHFRKKKVLVFLSTCAQVSFFYSAFCRLRPGTSILHLNGHMSDARRRSSFEEFRRKTGGCVMFSTDVCERGVDIPHLDWVVQADCPKDVETFIHRAGRTARMNRSGQCLLLLHKNEVAMVEKLKKAKISIETTEVRQNYVKEVTPKLQAFCADNDLGDFIKDKAVRCFRKYVKNYELIARSKKYSKVFNFGQLPFEEYSKSLGLVAMPKLSKRMVAKYGLKFEKDDFSLEKFEVAADCGSDDDFMTVQEPPASVFKEAQGNEVNPYLEAMDKRSKEGSGKKARSRAKEANRLLKKGISVNQRKEFDEEGEFERATTLQGLVTKDDLVEEGEKNEEGGIDVERQRLLMERRDVLDKERHAKLVKERKLARKLKRKAQKQGGGEEEGTVAYLGSPQRGSDCSSGEEQSGDEGSGSEEYEEPPVKRWKVEEEPSIADGLKQQEKEELALRLLGM